MDNSVESEASDESEKSDEEEVRLDHFPKSSMTAFSK